MRFFHRLFVFIILVLFSVQNPSLAKREDTTLFGKSRKQKNTGPVFPIAGGCQGVRKDARGDGAWLDNRNGNIHYAVDWYAPLGTALVSPMPGTVKVSKAKASGGGGQWIQIQHDNGDFTEYAHLKKRFVGAGERVNKNQPIGEVGKSGNASHRHTHPHVHFVYKNSRGQFKNPHDTFGCNEYARIALK